MVYGVLFANEKKSEKQILPFTRTWATITIVRL